jgi:hypothetical protein
LLARPSPIYVICSAGDEARLIAEQERNQVSALLWCAESIDGGRRIAWLDSFQSVAFVHQRRLDRTAAQLR